MLVSAADLRPAVSVSALVRPRSIGGSALVKDYLNELPAALSFFSGSPFRLHSFREKLTEVSSRFGPEQRREVATVLQPSSNNARERIERFVEEGGVVVTTGQQTGFLTGPLYTLYKALSAVALARHLERQLGTLVLPVFWIASEDHDWAEVNHAYLLDPADRLRRFSLPGSDDTRPVPMSERLLGGELDELCDEILQIVALQPDARLHARKILDPYRIPGRTVAEAFHEALASMLGQYDVVFVDAADPGLKRLSRSVLSAALVEAEAQEQRLGERSERIEAQGYSTQVAILEGGTNVFAHGEQGRQRLYRRGDDFIIRGRKGIVRRDELIADLIASPERFSPNVLLRPVVEATVLPSISYVGGPGEIAYFAQAGALFDHLGVRAPVVVPRFSGTVVEKGTERGLEKLGLSQADLSEGREALIERLARRDVPPEAEESLRSIREGLVEGFDRLAEQVEDLEPTLVGSLGAIRNRALHDSARAERRIIRAIKRKGRVTIEQLDRVLNALRPVGKEQDRVMSPLSYLARHGDQFLPQVESAIRAHWRLPE